MSRIGGEQITVRPTNNVYTALAAVGVVIEILALLALYLRAQEIIPPGLL